MQVLNTSLRWQRVDDRGTEIPGRVPWLLEARSETPVTATSCGVSRNC